MNNWIYCKLIDMERKSALLEFMQYGAYVADQNTFNSQVEWKAKVAFWSIITFIVTCIVIIIYTLR